MPTFGKKKKQEALRNNLEQEFIKIQQKYHLPPGDFPNLTKFRQNLEYYDIDKFKSLKKDLLERADEALSVDLPQLMSSFPMANPELEQAKRNPFDDFSQPAPGEVPPSYWHFSSIDKPSYTPTFNGLHPREGKVSGAAIKPILIESGLPNDTLAQIWRLADLDGDGYMDIDEFSIAMHLIKAVQNGGQLPEKLPSTMLPPRIF